MLRTLPKGATNCWRAAILSPSFSFLTWLNAETIHIYKYMFTEILEPDFEIGTILLLITNHTGQRLWVEDFAFSKFIFEDFENQTKPRSHRTEPIQSLEYSSVSVFEPRFTSSGDNLFKNHFKPMKFCIKIYNKACVCTYSLRSLNVTKIDSNIL